MKLKARDWLVLTAMRNAGGWAYARDTCPSVKKQTRWYVLDKLTRLGLIEWKSGGRGHIRLYRALPAEDYAGPPVALGVDRERVVSCLQRALGDFDSASIRISRDAAMNIVALLQSPN